MKKQRMITLLFCVLFMAAGIIAGRNAYLGNAFGPIEPPYKDTDIVRVAIVFSEDAVNASSMDAMIEKISEEALDGEELDVHRKITDYELTANVLHGKLQQIKMVEGVEKVVVMEEIPMTSQDTETDENVDDTENTGGSDDTVTTEDTEDTENTGGSDDTVTTEDTEDTENAGGGDDTENTGGGDDTENTVVEDDTVGEVKESKGQQVLIFAILIVLAGGIAAYFIKKAKEKQDE